VARALGPALLAAIAMALAGCVTIDGTLEADGSGTVEVTYPVTPNSSESREKNRFAAPHVAIESLAFHDDGTATARLTFDDPAKLSAVELFRSAAISRRREGDEERLLIAITSKVTTIKDEAKPGPRITITLPGPVLEANHNATIDGNRLTWRFGLAEFLRERTIELTARYPVPASAAHP
jgi:hypothetical protein